MYIQMGDYTNLEVLRETEISYILGDETTEIFLHKRQALRQLEVGEIVEVFLYYDNQKRITATMVYPKIDLKNPGFCEVIDQNFRLGVFLDIGLPKDLLLSRDDLPFVKREWPQKGDKLFVRMRASRNQLTAKVIPRYEIRKYLKPLNELEVGKKYFAYNVYKTEEGQVFYTEEGHKIYVYFKHLRKQYRIGQQEEIKVMVDKGDFSYGGSIIEQKELMISKDSEYILNYLRSNHGTMPYGDKSSATEIQERFNMSKSAFKRALGTLYKNEQIDLEGNQTTLRKEVE
jgi:predicted RNA-binding protein (virulence factor B family)